LQVQYIWRLRFYVISPKKSYSQNRIETRERLQISENYRYSTHSSDSRKGYVKWRGHYHGCL